MEKIVIGLITTLSGPKERIGRGILTSFEYIFSLHQQNLNSAKVPIELLVEDDRGKVHDAIRAMDRCMAADCALVIGPGDSDSFEALANERRFTQIPIIATFATATDITSDERRNVFRFTTPNDSRAELLLLQIRRLMPDARLEIYTEDGAPETYSQSIKRDVVAIAQRLNFEYREHSFSTGILKVQKPPRKAAIVICAASAAGVALLKTMRSSNIKNQAFGFGSNSNWLVADAENLIVVCDLDRNEANPRVRQYIDGFFEKHPDLNDPSLPTMNAAYILSQVFSSIAPRLGSMSVEEARKGIIESLRQSTFSGLFGPVAFAPQGEMAGFEQVVLSRVRKLSKGYAFTSLRDRERAQSFQKHSLGSIASAIIGFIGALTGLIGVIQYFFPH